VIRWPSGCCQVRTEQAKPAHAPGLTLARQADQTARAGPLWPTGMMSVPAGGGGDGAGARGSNPDTCESAGGVLDRLAAGKPENGDGGAARDDVGRARAGGNGVSADGHDGVSRRCPGHLAPTASIAALISFTYHLPL
jgi:hypothetical protein